MNLGSFRHCTGYFTGICLVLIAGLIPAQAVDTPIQAAARAALEQKMFELDHPQAPVPAVASALTNSATPPIVPVAKKTYAPYIVIAPAITDQTAMPTVKAQPAAAKIPPTLILAGAASSEVPPDAKLPDEVMNAIGATYSDAEVEKVDSDGLIVRYKPAGGGLAVTKIYFESLPPDIRKHYEKD